MGEFSISAQSLTQEYLRIILTYYPNTGIFRWNVNWGNIAPGMRAGFERYEKGTKYRFIKINRKPYPEHRLAWFYMTGEWPERLDHDDLDGTNNTWTNLRSATGSQNIANQGLRSDNTSGYKGVSYVKLTGKWIATIMYQGQSYHLGTFLSPEAASAAYASAALRFFGPFARTEKGRVKEGRVIDMPEE